MNTQLNVVKVKVVKPTNERYYNTLGTSVINSALSPLSLILSDWDGRVKVFPLKKNVSRIYVDIMTRVKGGGSGWVKSLY